MPTNASIESAVLPLFLAALCTDALILALAGALVFRYRLRLAADARLLRDWLGSLWDETPRSHRIVLAVITAVAALVRLPFLGRPLGTDEAATVLYYATKPLIVSLSVYGSPNNHLLHTALLRLTMAIGGSAEWVIRLPALAAGIALVPLTYAVARRSVGDGALIAAALAAGAPVFVDYSTDARGYTLLCCFALVSFAAMLPVVGHGNTVAVALFAIASALGFFTVPVMLYPFTAIVVWALLRAERPRIVLAGAATAMVLTLAFYAPVLLVSGFGSLAANPYVRPLPLDRFLAAIPAGVTSSWRTLMTALPVALQAALLLGAAVTIVRRRSYAAVAALVAVAAILAVQRTIPFPRVWLPFVLFLFVEAAAAVRLRRDEPWIAIVVVVIAGTLAVRVPRLRDTGELPHVREIARDLRVIPASTPIVAATPSDLPLAWYLRRPDVLRPDFGRRRFLVVTNERYGHPLAETLAAFHLQPSSVLARQIRDYGGAAVYEVVRLDLPRGTR